MKVAVIVLVICLCGMVLAVGGIALSSYAIKKGCAEKIADGTLTESERAICRRHGHL